jgi:hypothetical protein
LVIAGGSGECEREDGFVLFGGGLIKFWRRRWRRKRMKMMARMESATERFERHQFGFNIEVDGG